MYIVIVGCGRLGSTLARELSNDGHDVTIIDKDEECLDILGSGFNGTRIKGVEIDSDIFIEAGIAKADAFLAMTRQDNINIMAAQIAKNIFNVPKVIARIFDTHREVIYKKLGIETISPTELGIVLVKNRLIQEDVYTLTSLGDGMSVIEIPIHKNKQYTVEQIELKYNCIISVVLKDGVFSLVQKDEKLKNGEIIVCTVENKYKDKLIASLKREAFI